MRKNSNLQSGDPAEILPRANKVRALGILIGNYTSETPVPLHFNLWPYVGDILEELAIELTTLSECIERTWQQKR